jgi:hypothetical protein
VESSPVVAPVDDAGSVGSSELADTKTVVRRSARVYVVRRGDSLWSIAARLLESRASAAAVARKVARLWRLNKARIGTGDPSVLPVGVRLRVK